MANLTYAAQLTKSITDLRSDTAKTSGQASQVPLFICLPWPRVIATADAQVAASVPGVYVACDTAKLEKSEGLHLTSRGSRAAGAAPGAAIEASVF